MCMIIFTILHTSIKWFQYAWDSKKKSFSRLHGLDKDTPLHLFGTVFSQGLSKENQSMKQVLHGPNRFDILDF